MGIGPSDIQKEQLKVDTPGRCIFDLDDNTLSTGGYMPQLPLEVQIKDQVTAIFNRIRSQKFESDLSRNLSKSLNDQIQLHGSNDVPCAEAEHEREKDHEENILLSRPFRLAFGFVFCGYENFIIQSSDNQASNNILKFDKVSFLSEQPVDHVDFLAAFLETQSFASFIDEKIHEGRSMSNNLNEFDELTFRIRENHTNIDTFDECHLPLSEMIKNELKIEKDLGYVTHKLQLELSSKPMPEFPSLYSPPLSIPQVCPNQGIQLNDPNAVSSTASSGIPSPKPSSESNSSHGNDDKELKEEMIAAIHYKFISKIIKGLGF